MIDDAIRYQMYGVVYTSSDRETLLQKLQSAYGVTIEDICASSTTGGKLQDANYKKMLDDVFGHSQNFDFGLDEDNLLIVGYHAGVKNDDLDSVDHDLMEATPYVLKQAMKHLGVSLGSRECSWHTIC